jgi:hypothetical protein
MKTVGLLLLTVAVQSCFFHPYFKNKDREWWYFEDWDTNNDFTIDRNEFTTGFENNKVIRRISPDARSVRYADFDSLVVKLTKKTGERRENKATAASLDIDGDQKLSEPELVAAMFAIADDNKDNVLSGVEFYQWEVYL